MGSERNINTVAYWDHRFRSGDWETKGGYSQTRAFAESFVPRLRLGRGFSGTLCDFGCGAGDAFPVYRAAFPNARLVGVDFSQEAITLCQEKYSHIAEFIVGDSSNVPICDVVIASNVLEHIENDNSTVRSLLEKCVTLFVIVPYKERPLSSEHVRVYDERSFCEFPLVRTEVFASRGWSECGLRRIWAIYIRNIMRYIVGVPIRHRKLQSLFELCGKRSSDPQMVVSCD